MRWKSKRYRRKNMRTGCARKAALGIVPLLPALLLTAAQVFADTHYVDVNSASPGAPYTNWAKAAKIIQDAVDAATAGDTVLVTNGVYATGGRVVYGAMTNRVAITKAITTRSVNGPAVTLIQGRGPAGDSAVRCAYVGTNALLSGFTLTNGFTRISGDLDKECSGGGAWSEASGVISNCTLTANAAYNYGGGAYGGTLSNCTLTANSANGGGGVHYGTLNHCTLGGNTATFFGGGASGGTLNDCALIGNASPWSGGGASDSTLNRCTLTGNAADEGGGAYGGTLYNCTLTDNSAASSGGGMAYAALTNCTLSGNSATNGGGAYQGTLYNCKLIANSGTNGGGAYSGRLNNCTLANNCAARGGGSYYGTLDNCIIYYNAAQDGSNYYSGTLGHSCTTPAAPGNENITNAPVFQDAPNDNYSLAPTSPCVDAGINQDWMFGSTDLDGNPRVINGTVDMGAYETPFTLRLRALLQGPYDTSGHAMVADISGMIPPTSPYATDPRTVAAIPSNAVDWVLVELLTTNGETVVSKSAFLNTWGQLLASDGGTAITAELSAGCYSVVLKHRNHLAAMSAQ